MQIGLRLHDSAKLELKERLRIVKGQGFSCVHLALSKIEGLAGSAEALTPGYAMYLRHTFEEAGLDIAVLGNYLNLAHFHCLERRFVTFGRHASGAIPQYLDGAVWEACPD